MTIVRRESLADQAAEQLLARLRAGEWGVGDKLPGEVALAAQFGVGRSTAREAIRILAARGVLSTRQGAGVFVEATEVPENWDVMVRRADIVAVLEARTAIESEAAALAAERRDVEALENLRLALEDRDLLRADLAEHVESDMRFHRAIVVAAQSPVLLELFDGFAQRSREAMTGMLRMRGHHGEDADQEVHRRILDAIAAQDPQAAAAQTRAHLLALRDLHVEA
ncbi:MAG: FadR family transcriptional regulator [Arthrobacter sp.]|nr:FadR family transcriptional regulator [Arthrobacter sp.]